MNDRGIPPSPSARAVYRVDRRKLRALAKQLLQDAERVRAQNERTLAAIDEARAALRDLERSL